MFDDKNYENISDLVLNEKKEIKSDFNFAINLTKNIFIYLIFFIPRLVGIFVFLIFNYDRAKKYFSTIVTEPFKFIKSFFDWFFEAKVTSWLSIFLIIVYVFQVFYIIPVLGLNNFVYSFFDFFKGNYYSIFTSIFLHGGLVHLFGNILFLVIFGRIVEKHFKGWTLLIFLFSGIISNLISGYIFYINGITTHSLGASGGIAGLIILAILLEPFSFSCSFIIPLPIFIIGWFFIFSDILGIFSNFNSHINHLAHLSGYFTLIIFFFFLNINHRKKIMFGLFINIISILSLFILFYFIGYNQVDLFVEKIFELF